MDKIRVLFLCIANSARSQMAEALLREYGGEKFEVYSAGLEPMDIHPLARKVMAEIGLDMHGQYAKSLMDYMGKKHFSYLITVCSQAEKMCPTTFPGMGQRLHWNIENPELFQGSEEARLNKFREIRDQISDRIKNWMKTL